MPRTRSERTQATGQLDLGHIDAYLRENVHIELLAYLEYSVFERKDPSDFVKAASKQSEYSKGTIEEKLGLISQSWGPVNSQNSGFRKLIILGLKALPRIPPDVADEVRKRAEDLQRTTPRPRALRSVSRTPTSATTASPNRSRRKFAHRLRSEHLLFADVPSSPVQARRTRSPKPPHSRGQYAAAARLSVSFSQRSSQPRINTESTPQTPLKKEIPSSYFSDSEELSLLESESADDSGQGQLQGTVLATEPCLSKILDNGIVPQGTWDLQKACSKCQALQSSHEISLAHIEALEEKLEAARIENSGLQECCDRAEAKYANIQADYGRLHTMLALRNPGVLNLDDSSSLEKKYSNSRRELERTQAILQYSIIPLTLPKGENSKLLNRMNDMQMKSRDVLRMYDNPFTFDFETFRNDGALEILFRKAFGVNITQSPDIVYLNGLLPDITIRSVIRALLGAAICEWVYEADLKSLCQESDRLYSNFRDLLMGQNAEATRCYEFAALQATLDEPRMDGYAIPNRAILLTRRLLKTLSPVLKSQNGLGRGFDTLTEDWLGEEARLTEVFKLALQTAIRILLTTDLYKCVYHSPGTRFNDSMASDLEASTAGLGAEAIVGFTLLPGLQRCEANERHMTFRRFLTDTEVSNQMAWVPWCQPLVSTR